MTPGSPRKPRSAVAVFCLINSRTFSDGHVAGVGDALGLEIGVLETDVGVETAGGGSDSTAGTGSFVARPFWER